MQGRFPAIRVEPTDCRFELPDKIMQHFRASKAAFDHRTAYLLGGQIDEGLVKVADEYSVKIAEFVPGGSFIDMGDFDRVLQGIHTGGQVAVGYLVDSRKEPLVTVFVHPEFEKIYQAYLPSYSNEERKASAERLETRV